MKKLSLLLALSLLTACSTLPPAAFRPQGETPRSTSALKHWALQGSMGIRTPQEGTNATIHWQQSGQRYALQIYGPLGIYRIQLEGTPNNVVLQSEGQTYRASSAESLLKQQLGWSIPVSNLVYWVRGLAAPGFSANAVRDSQNRLTTLTQQGWQIQYLDYVNVKQLELPRKIVLTQPQLQVRFVIRQWTI
jgi:outer membrane lipoprotein LolB